MTRWGDKFVHKSIGTALLERVLDALIIPAIAMVDVLICIGLPSLHQDSQAQDPQYCFDQWSAC